MTGKQDQRENMMKETENEPVVLELAPLPREQIGPFLLLGLAKNAGKEEIEAHWAQRVIWARRNQIAVSLADIHWAREVLNDPERRVRADAASLNADTTDTVLRSLTQRFGLGDRSSPSWQPLEAEKPLADYVPDTPMPDLDEIREAIVVPEVSEEIPAVRFLLEQWIGERLDPWKLPIGAGAGNDNSRPIDNAGLPSAN